MKCVPGGIIFIPLNIGPTENIWKKLHQSLKIVMSTQQQYAVMIQLFVGNESFSAIEFYTRQYP